MEETAREGESMEVERNGRKEGGVWRDSQRSSKALKLGETEGRRDGREREREENGRDRGGV